MAGGGGLGYLARTHGYVLPGVDERRHWKGARGRCRLRSPGTDQPIGTVRLNRTVAAREAPALQRWPPVEPLRPPAPYGTVAPDDARIVAVLESMRDRGGILEPTISVMRYLSEEARAWAIDLTRLAHEMDIPISTGTDAALLVDEIEALVRDVGLGPLQAVESATSVGGP